MKASIDYKGIVKVQSENEYEDKLLEKFLVEGHKHGYYHYSSAQDSEGTTVWVAVDKD